MSTSRHASPRLALAALALLLLAALPAFAERGDDADRASKNGRAEGTVGGAGVTVEYGRPQVKERQIWGGLVPYGEVWRTGANEATTITFDRDVTIAGQQLAAGTYGLFTIPGEKEWTVIFNKQPEQWGAYDYDPAMDALRVTVAPRPAEHVEAMDFELADDTVTLRWEKLAVPFTVAAAAATAG